MEIKELRINNLIQYQNEVVSVAGISLGKDDDAHLIQIRLGKKKMIKPFVSLEPIPLTSVWMSKLGFAESYRSDSRIRYDVPQIGKYDFDLSNNKMLEGFLYCGHYIQCQYLHQLQNIYFVLTGEELKIRDQSENQNAEEIRDNSISSLNKI